MFHLGENFSSQHEGQPCLIEHEMKVVKFAC